MWLISSSKINNKKKKWSLESSGLKSQGNHTFHNRRGKKKTTKFSRGFCITNHIVAQGAPGFSQCSSLTQSYPGHYMSFVPQPLLEKIIPLDFVEVANSGLRLYGTCIPLSTIKHDKGWRIWHWEKSIGSWMIFFFFLIYQPLHHLFKGSRNWGFWFCDYCKLICYTMLLLLYLALIFLQ